MEKDRVSFQYFFWAKSFLAALGAAQKYTFSSRSSSGGGLPQANPSPQLGKRGPITLPHYYNRSLPPETHLLFRLS